MGETIETMTGLTAHGSSTSGTSTDAATIGTTSDQEVECYDVDKPLLLGGQCYSPSEVRHVFVTSEKFNGSMDNPDKKCADAASKTFGKKAENFKAWATVDGDPPANTFDKGFHGPYVKLNPNDDPNVDSDAVVLVAMGWAELTSGNLMSAVDVTEIRTTVSGYAWTAATADGSTDKYLADCNKWMSNNLIEKGIWTCEEAKNDYGSVGRIGATDSSWSVAENLKCALPGFCCFGNFDWFHADISECDSQHHLYCIQDKMTR